MPADAPKPTKPRKLSISRKVILGVAFTLFMLALIALTSFISTRRFLAVSAKVAETREILERIERVLLALVRAARPEDYRPGELHGGVGGGSRGLVAHVQRDGNVPIPTNCWSVWVFFCVFFFFGVGEFEKPRGAPLRHHPVRRLEVGCARYAAQGCEVVGGEEEGVVELVFVDEEGGGEG